MWRRSYAFPGRLKLKRKEASFLIRFLKREDPKSQGLSKGSVKGRNERFHPKIETNTSLLLDTHQKEEK